MRQKKITALLLAAILLLGLCACNLAPDPNVGKYNCYSVEMMGFTLNPSEAFSGETSVELKRGNKITLIIDGDTIDSTYSTAGTAISATLDGEECVGTLKDGLITFEMGSTGMTMYFALEGVTPPVVTPDVLPSDPDPSPNNSTKTRPGGSSNSYNGYNVDGNIYFTIYNESDYDIYAIYVGRADASSDDDIDVLPYILKAGESYFVDIYVDEADWNATEWTIYIEDDEGDYSADFEVFNPWEILYVDVYWSNDAGGYICDFVY